MECRNCGKPLSITTGIADGCPCNSPRGINHGLVPAYICTCPICDPHQTGSVRHEPKPITSEFLKLFGCTPVDPDALSAYETAMRDAIPNIIADVDRRRKLAMDARNRQLAAESNPVDRSQQQLTDGSPVPDDRSHTELKSDGQQRGYVVLSPDERARGFVRPVRRTYRHTKCGTNTSMSQSIAETYARDPKFYSGTFCVACGKHFPVGPDGEFVWIDDGTRVGT